MINVGIIGGDTEAAGELIRILINHPDVILRGVTSSEHAGERLDRFHRGLVGDTDLCFVRTLPADRLNCVFLVGESWQAEEFMRSLEAPETAENLPDEEREDAMRVIDMTGSFLDGRYGMVYGFPEHNRKAMVRGALRASIPSAITIAADLSLFPLVKNYLLKDRTSVNVVLPRRSVRYIAASSPVIKGVSDRDVASEISTRLDPVAPIEHRPDSDRSVSEIMRMIREIDPASTTTIAMTVSVDESQSRGMTVECHIPCRISVDEVRRIYDEAYDDHGFTYPIDREGGVEDITNTNKCLLHISPEGGDMTVGGVAGIKVTGVLDNLIKGSAGTAVHCMNLLFGLSERTGLALKLS